MLIAKYSVRKHLRGPNYQLTIEQLEINPTFS